MQELIPKWVLMIASLTMTALFIVSFIYNYNQYKAIQNYQSEMQAYEYSAYLNTNLDLYNNRQMTGAELKKVLGQLEASGYVFTTGSFNCNGTVISRDSITDSWVYTVVFKDSGVNLNVELTTSTIANDVKGESVAAIKSDIKGIADDFVSFAASDNNVHNTVLETGSELYLGGSGLNSDTSWQEVGIYGYKQFVTGLAEAAKRYYRSVAEGGITDTFPSELMNGYSLSDISETSQTGVYNCSLSKYEGTSTSINLGRLHVKGSITGLSVTDASESFESVFNVTNVGHKALPGTIESITISNDCVVSQQLFSTNVTHSVRVYMNKDSYPANLFSLNAFAGCSQVDVYVDMSDDSAVRSLGFSSLSDNFSTSNWKGASRATFHSL